MIEIGGNGRRDSSDHWAFSLSYVQMNLNVDQFLLGM